MKKFLLSIATLFMFSTVVPEHFAQGKVSTYYETKLTSATGKQYRLALKSANVKKKIADEDDMWAGISIGDQLYRGTFQFYMNGKKTSYKTGITYNKTRKNFYKVPSKKGTPSFLAISDPQGTDIDDIKLYYVYNGTLRKLNRTFTSTLNVKYSSKNVIKMAGYDNTVSKYHIYYFKVNPETGGSKWLKTKTVSKKPW